MQKLRVISNLAKLSIGGGEDCQVELLDYPRALTSLRTRLRFFLKSFGCHYVVMNNQLIDLLTFAAFQYLIPFNRCRLISVDTILGDGPGFASWVKRWIKIILLKKVQSHYLYFKDIADYSRVFRIRPNRFRYVPFKINSYEQVISTKTRDDGFIFTGGISRRDYTTFLKAVVDLPYPVKMIAGEPSVLSEHETYFDADLLTSRVELLTEYNPERYIEVMAASRLVVVPLRGDTLTPGGISAYPDAMALGKCVIISSGYAVDGVLSGEMVMIVPPGDADALKAAIKRAWNDPELRRRYGECGKEYAIKLGDDERFMKSIVAELLKDYLSDAEAPERGSVDGSKLNSEKQPDLKQNRTQQMGEQ